MIRISFFIDPRQGFPLRLKAYLARCTAYFSISAQLADKIIHFEGGDQVHYYTYYILAGLCTLELRGSAAFCCGTLKEKLSKGIEVRTRMSYGRSFVS